MGIALLTAALVFFLAAAHPFLIYPLSLRVLARYRPSPVRQGQPPARMAVCVCAYNEQAVIAARIENLLGLRKHFPDLEILVYVDAASDATAEIAARYAGAIQLIVASERLGKTHGMNTLVSRTNADIIVFSDANVRFAEAALAKLLAPIEDRSFGCVCGHLLYEGTGSTASAATPYKKTATLSQRSDMGKRAPKPVQKHNHQYIACTSASRPPHQNQKPDN